MLKNSWVFVTGASSGIGQSTSIKLAEQGANLVLLARRRERLEEVKKLCLEKNNNIQIELLVCDLQNLDELQRVLSNQQGLISKIDVLINNAGLAKGTDFVGSAQWSHWNEMIDTNIKSLFFLTSVVLPSMEKKTSGHIVNMGSVAGKYVYPGGAVYCATKFAVRAFSEGLRMDTLGKNIRVTNIEPGMVNTEFSYVRLKDQAKADKVYENMTPLSANDIAETIVWCLQRPAHVNIQELVIYPTDQAHVGQVHRHPK